MIRISILIFSAIGLISFESNSSNGVEKNDSIRQVIDIRDIDKLISNCDFNSRARQVDTLKNEIKIQLENGAYIKITRMPDIISNADDPKLDSMIDRGLSFFTILSCGKAYDDGRLWTYAVEDKLKHKYFKKYKAIDFRNNLFLIQVFYPMREGKKNMDKFDCITNELKK